MERTLSLPGLDGKPVVVDTVRIEALLAADPAMAAATLLQAARRGHPHAQTWLGQLYLDGRGVPRDAGEACYWFRRAAHAGLPMAMNMLGRCHDHGWGTPVDYTLAAIWYRRAGEAGSDWGCYNYAHLLDQGRGVPRDTAAAIVWFERAAAMGHGRAMHFLGSCYERGHGVPRDRARAIELYRHAAATGDYRGLCSWASVLCERGEIDAALACLRRAVAQAPAHYLRALARTLEAAAHATLRDFGLRIAAQLDAAAPPSAARETG
ncbi:MAG: tetratricopeptide repeat protein [Fulvimonas sp.]|jgi:tetratricopeptide (TPR) repeat protein|nr:tetratricopeptide repeat protein [Fulvimonas sp.]